MPHKARPPAKIALEDGTVLHGESIGAAGESVGEVVFNTSLTGYQEIFTDPSYNGQMVVMTNPLIGNYGINPDDEESFRPFVRGVIVRELSRRPSNFRSRGPLDEYLEKFGIVGIAGVDTRALTKLIRVSGSLKGVVACGDDLASDAALIEKAKAWSGLDGVDMVSEVTCSRLDQWRQGFTTPFANCFRANCDAEALGSGLKIVAFDFGIKFNILRILCEMGFEVHVLPAHATVEDVEGLEPDGVFLSNGPGDPEGLPYAIETVRKLIGRYPLFGICLGHQLTSLALGAEAYKLRFGHHGGNHPVKNLLNGKVEISVQNHCYAIRPESLDSKTKPYFVNLNDGSLEGIYHEELPLFTVQFHPESAPGPNDFTLLFDQYARMIRDQKPLLATQLG